MSVITHSPLMTLPLSCICHYITYTPAYTESAGSRQALEIPEVPVFAISLYITTYSPFHSFFFKPSPSSQKPYIQKKHIKELWYLSPTKTLISQVSNLAGAGAAGIWCPMLSLWCLQAYQEQSSLILFGWAVWHVLGGVNTDGSLMPSCMSKNRVDNITL